MQSVNHGECNESFLTGANKVVDLIQFFEGMVSANKMDETLDGKKKQPVEVKDISAEVTDDNFVISQRLGADRMSTSVSAKRSRSRLNKAAANLNQFTFMRQLDQTDEQQVQARIERERVANNYRRQGNFEYRRSHFESAIELYTRGLDYIHDTPVLYLNRACCYIKLRNYKRALIDCDYILNHLDPKYLRAWLYRAGAYQRLGDDQNYEYSVYQAKRLNYKDLEYIETFLEKVRSHF
ncbi:maker221 [Drosophila busckii]|uniref:Maker221 n=1 Tax=Drosophila busckii TaxID=30019 RepID=A0A0M4F5G0_DROBS|nr:tetratricopeptide repeat protein 12 [Drosophila busckii]ALC47100.1 maker221 [Drosophila busckii]